MLILALILSLSFAACVDTTGLSSQSSRLPAGNSNAAVTVQEYADLQCPACKAAHAQIVQPLLRQDGDRIRYEFMHFPLRSLHRFALEAAMAAECAADQGKFWQFVDLDYERQGELSREALSAWAKDLQLDADLFGRCMDSEIKRDTIVEDYEKGRSLGVTGTPTFFVNGKRVESDLEVIRAAIDEVLRGVMQRL